MSKDWTGNSRSAYATLGARNFAKEDREKYDYYATEPKATEELLKLEHFSHYIWEPAAGEGHIAEVLKSHNYDVVTNDIIERNYPLDGEMDFFNVTKENMSNTIPRDIITNPPYKYAKEFVEHALDSLSENILRLNVQGCKVCPIGGVTVQGQTIPTPRNKKCGVTEWRCRIYCIF